MIHLFVWSLILLVLVGFLCYYIIFGVFYCLIKAFLQREPVRTTEEETEEDTNVDMDNESSETLGYESSALQDEEDEE